MSSCVCVILPHLNAAVRVFGFASSTSWMKWRQNKCTELWTIDRVKVLLGFCIFGLSGVCLAFLFLCTRQHGSLGLQWWRGAPVAVWQSEANKWQLRLSTSMGLFCHLQGSTRLPETEIAGFCWTVTMTSVVFWFSRLPHSPRRSLCLFFWHPQCSPHGHFFPPVGVKNCAPNKVFFVLRAPDCVCICILRKLLRNRVPHKVWAYHLSKMNKFKL